MNASAPSLARRCDAVAPFFVLELIKEAEQLERSGRSIVHLSVGEPDFTAPQPVEPAWSAHTRGVLIGSPSNPTGTTIQWDALAQLCDRVLARGGFVLVDEIYQGLTYDHAPATALSLDPRVAVINSFSKYFGMTGWRLGWIVAPPEWVAALERLSQNLYLCASAIAQHAALACFEADSLEVFEQRREQFRQRRNFLLPALRQLGFGVPVVPDGAFYVYADISTLTRADGDRFEGSSQFARRLLHEAGVCLVPGKDFGRFDAERYVRLSYATSMEKLQEAIRRIGAYLGR